MDFGSLFGSLIGAGANLLAGNQASKDRQAALDQQAAINQTNIQEQEKFAQNSIQWKVADAAKVGISPLAAIGASSGASFSNIAGNSDLGSPRADYMSKMGQELGRAANALSTKEDKQAQLEAKLTEAKIANVNSDTTRNLAAVSQIQTRHGQPGTISTPKAPPSLWTEYDDGKGGKVRLPSKDASSSMQNWASMPVQIPVAVSQAGDALQYEYHKLMDPVYSGVSGAAKRSLDRWSPPDNSWSQN